MTFSENSSEAPDHAERWQSRQGANAFQNELVLPALIVDLELRTALVTAIQRIADLEERREGAAVRQRKLYDPKGR